MTTFDDTDGSQEDQGAPPPPPPGFAAPDEGLVAPVPPPGVDFEFGYDAHPLAPPPGFGSVPPSTSGDDEPLVVPVAGYGETVPAAPPGMSPPPPPPPDGGSMPMPYDDQPRTPSHAAPGDLVAAPTGRAAMVKATRGHSPAEAATRLGRRYLWVAVAVAAAILLANLLPSVGKSTTPSATSGNGVAANVTPATAQYASGATVGGVVCGPGIRQVPWSDYAPPCQPAWHGDNGGATTSGVTSKTITLSYRGANTSQLAELFALLPQTVVGNSAEAITTMQDYINLFNRSFELYGRKVKLVPFTGKGDFITETLGGGQAQAQEDAVTVATSIKAFADISLIDSSALYTSDLASKDVVSSTLYENADPYFKDYAPWIYSPGPNCTQTAEATGAILSKQLGGLPASLAGSASLRSQKRKFGMIYPLNGQAGQCAGAVSAAMAHFGHPVVKSVSVKFDLSSLISASAAAVAEMKAAGVTTVILSSANPITPKFLLEAADNDHYYPEWWFQSYTGSQTNADAFTRIFPADQIKDAFGIGTQTLPKSQQEAYKAFELGAPAGAQPLPSYIYAYESLLEFFDALQLAGPDLTPASFSAAMHRIPVSKPGGMLMPWAGGTYDAAAKFGVVRYDANRVSPLDGQLGTYIGCDGHQYFPYTTTGAGVPAHHQLSCSPTG